MEITLKDIRPQGAQFALSLTKRLYRLRPINVEDELWMAEKFGANLQEILTRGQMDGVCQIVYHQLEHEDREEFREQVVTFVDDSGKEAKETKGGYKLLLCMISGTEEKLAIFEALLKTIGISRPVLEKLSETTDEASPQKKTPRRPTGQRSSTSSARSTAGKRNTSSRSR